MRLAEEDAHPSQPQRCVQEFRRTSAAATIPEPAIRARAAAGSRVSSGMPPVRGNGLAEALMEAPALIISSPIALALDIGLAEAVDIGLALADALALIIWSSSICATAAGANT
ncbi:MAG: hypothetical protein M3118_07635 [Actinomycetota bacterium]|nr:hypothetical protein [Actinomycetota bacterium]